MIKNNYESLLSLYKGVGTNADVTPPEFRAAIDVTDDTAAEVLGFWAPGEGIPGQDVIITGNPGDGKSHLAKKVIELNDGNESAEISGKDPDSWNVNIDDYEQAHLLDGSEFDGLTLLNIWQKLRDQPAEESISLLICINEGPLRELLELLESDLAAEQPRFPNLHAIAKQISDQLYPELNYKGGTTTNDIIVFNLGSRNFLTHSNIASAIQNLCADSSPFLGKFASWKTSVAGLNATLLSNKTIRNRFARLIANAVFKSGQHFTMRELWSVLSYSICLTFSEGTLKTPKYQQRTNKNGEKYTGWTLDKRPLCNLFYNETKTSDGLFEIIRGYADPAQEPLSDLERELWTHGKPKVGHWLEESFIDDLEIETPAKILQKDPSAVEAAYKRLDNLKRLVCLAHSEGENLFTNSLKEFGTTYASKKSEKRELRNRLLKGICQLYLRESQADQHNVAKDKLPLWVANTYKFSLEQNSIPYTAVHQLDFSKISLSYPNIPVDLKKFMISVKRYPRLVYRFQDKDGVKNSVSLRISPALEEKLLNAENGGLSGVYIPEVQNFLNQLAFCLVDEGETEDSWPVLVLDKIGGSLVVEAMVINKDGEAKYDTKHD